VHTYVIIMIRPAATEGSADRVAEMDASVTRLHCYLVSREAFLF
jgi:hypothetical protein